MDSILSSAISGASPTSSTFSTSSHKIYGASAHGSLFVPSTLSRRGGVEGRGASLGSNAKSSAELPTPDPMALRVARFALQSVARKFLPDSRTSKCLRLRAFGQEIKVIRSMEYRTASYTGLQTCGSVWACPVCAAKIAERRRVEIQAAMAFHKASGGAVNLLTLTTPHQRTDSLKDLLAMQAVALKYFFKDYTAKAVLQELGTVGQIRALEVTHGRLSPSNNGWHPHYHLLVFCASKGSLDAFAERLYIRWAACCVRAGLGEPSRLHGLKLDDGMRAASYVSKWGLEDEMTKGHTKKARHGETPFDFLRSYLADAKDKQAGALFKEFAETFKGKRQLYWSQGLKKRFGIGEISDQELLAKTEDDAAFLGMITLDQWKEVLRDDGRGFLLQLASKFGWSPVAEYLEVMQERHNERKRLESLTVLDEVTAGWSAVLKREFAKTLNLKGSK